MIQFPYTTTVIEVSQPLATFYVAVLPAELLLQTSFSDTLKAIRDQTGAYSLQGVQRLIDDDRIKAIGSYISRTDSAFPNSIILAANYLTDGFVEERTELKWRIDRDPLGTLTLTIPTADQMVAVIDGQHRLFGFARASENRLAMQLLCSIYLDLPKPYQAQLFATINSTQKKVSKSLTYELFGYNISDEDSEHWAPDKLAVFLARKLNAQTDSPLENRILVAALDEFTDDRRGDFDWKVSMATIVDGIIRLISTNPIQDGNELLAETPRRRSQLVRPDSSPLRDLYTNNDDELLYLTVFNFFAVVKRLFWDRADEESYIYKTVGFQALLDVLRFLAPYLARESSVSQELFEQFLAPAAGLNFSEGRFRIASAVGRGLMKNAIIDLIRPVIGEAI